MGQYRKKPVVIDAWQFTKKNYAEGAPNFIKYADGWPVVSLMSQYGGEIISGEIKTLEGIMQVSENDWIIKGTKGEFYPCKPDIFEITYESVGLNNQPKKPETCSCDSRNVPCYC